MAGRKGLSPQKGKQPIKKRKASQLSPVQSSSDEEAWPIWQEMQEKISATWPAGVQLCRSAREAKSHKRARLRVMAHELTQRFAVLKSAQVSNAQCSGDICYFQGMQSGEAMVIGPRVS